MSSTILKPEQLAAIMLLTGFPANDRVIAEGLAVVEQESGFNYTITSDGVHIGLWQEEESFGSKSDRENPVKSTQAAHKRWVADGNTFADAWGQWDGQAQNNYRKYLPTAKKVVSEYMANGGKAGGGVPWQGIGPDIEGVVSGAASAVTGATDFVGDLVGTLLNFRKLGELLAKVIAWVLRLVFKAIWDYCIAPIFHWNERAVTYYYKTFFSYGNNKGKTGFDRIYRENAGIITIIFWALGYGILWTTPDSPLKMANSPRESILGRSIKAIEGRVSKRSLVKPKDVKDKTPPKPTPRESVVTVEKTKEFRASRKRPVSVESDSSTKGREHVGNQEVGEGEGEGEGEGTEVILPVGVARPQKTQKTPPASTTKAGGTGMGSQSDRSRTA